MDPGALQRNIILFDGVCNLCNYWVNFTIRRDRKNVFYFAPLQSAIAQQIIGELGLQVKDMESFVYLEKGNAYLRSSAALRIARRLPGAWPLFFGFIIVPPFIRNGIYNYIAKNRYRWWGKRETCMAPSEELKKKFIS